MEIRLGRIIVGKAGGTAGENSKTYKISIPTKWINDMNISDKNRAVELSFDGNSITVSPILTMEEYLQKKLSLNHNVYKLSYYDNQKLCTMIYADFSDKTIKAENFTDNVIKTAFGNNALPTWEAFLDFLEERCIPRGREGLRNYLDVIGVVDYEPFEIVKKTKGRMAEDEQWLDVEEVR
jgi:hypothetical protein